MPGSSALNLYPENDPFDTRSLPVGDGHCLHVERYGNPEGRPVVLLHGGPGASWSPHMIRFFDPGHYHIIAFDQRGAWRSTPLGSLHNNTTQHLIGDIETIREMLGIDRWVVQGWSWGSALALAYAETHPERCAAVLVQGIVLFRPGFEYWDFRDSRDLFPDAFARLEAFAPAEYRNDLYEWYRDVILGDDTALALEASDQWYQYSEVLSNAHRVDPALTGPEETDGEVLAGSRISMHYWQNAAFLPEDTLYRNAHRLSGIPGSILHGEKDFNCLVSAAHDLHAVWPEADFHTIPNAGHSIFEPETARLLVEAADRFKDL